MKNILKKIKISKSSGKYHLKALLCTGAAALIMPFIMACTGTEANAAAATDEQNSAVRVINEFEDMSTADTGTADVGMAADQQEDNMNENKADGTEADTEMESRNRAQESLAAEGTENENMITLRIGDVSFTATLYDNETADAFKEQLPVTLDMSELNGNEKYHYLSFLLPASASRPERIEAGDIMLYGSDCLVLFYESFNTSYSYTPIGKLDDTEGLLEALGSGAVTIGFER